MDSDAGSATNLPAMFRCKPLAVAVFAMWTLLVWANRIYNIVAKDGVQERQPWWTASARARASG